MALTACELQKEEITTQVLVQWSGAFWGQGFGQSFSVT